MTLIKQVGNIPKVEQLGRAAQYLYKNDDFK